MNALDAIRFLAHEARRCREIALARAQGKATDLDTQEMFNLVPPAVEKVYGLKPMDDDEARAFEWQLHQELIGKNAPEFAEI